MNLMISQTDAEGNRELVLVHQGEVWEIPLCSTFSALPDLEGSQRQKRQNLLASNYGFKFAISNLCLASQDQKT